MLPYYKPTDTEYLICDLYQTLDINHPHEMDIELIAALWGADIIYYKGKPKAHWDEYGSVIFLNQFDSSLKQRADFFHELGHIARHEGHQDDLPDLYVELQELQSWHFALISAIPYYLLPTPLEMTWSEYVGLLAEEFRVPVEFAAERVDQISSRLDEEYHYYREDTDLMRSKIESAVLMFRSRPPGPSQETTRLLTQLKYQTRGTAK
ncbi:ImmA/IrrE family metallo-endopeptidase [Paenibacillus sp. JX-17]|uniref:ImmA/IrrE family metallo-endopeptidase n=1 Tax=Paenibacillus lacisoli TaxID=3064525 RepID=A0ABT9CLJ4_9BACL|nr:ImmA/IrrE family metallo-endopeptidase [Paenibacillus sp. JX-17]MDO7908473.1 ImmA/IrrE family metallo-endopeptidase [Paenibacillus sp. JX-17]